MYYIQYVYVYTASVQKTPMHTFVHIFDNYSPIYKNFFTDTLSSNLQ